MGKRNMATMGTTLRKAAVWVAGAALCSSVLAPGVARADESTPTGKGIAGGVLLGGELVMSVEAALGASRPLAFGLGAIGGGIAGGIGGYFVEQSVDNAKIPSYMLAAGIAFLLPATVMAFNATAYKPPADYQEDKGLPGSEPVADAPVPGAPAAPAPPAGGGAGTPPTQGPLSQAPARAPRGYAFRRRPLVAAPQLALPTSVIAYQGELRLGVPAVEVRPVFSQQELRQFGMAQREEVRIPVFQARFLASCVRALGR